MKDNIDNVDNVPGNDKSFLMQNVISNSMLINQGSATQLILINSFISWTN